MAARAFGTATVSFGLVSIPIKIYTTHQPGTDISFSLLHADCGTKLKQQYVCPRDNVVVPRERMARGYEYAKGQYVMLSDEEMKALESVADSTIALGEFVPAGAVDPVYIEKSYYLGPDKGGERAYVLLSRAMQATGLVGMARYAARGKQHLVMVRPYGEGGLAMHQLRYADEVRAFAEVPVGKAPAAGDAELELAVQIIQHVASDAFRPERYTDEVKARIRERIEQKVEGHAIEAAEPQAPRGEIIDLMAALKASLGMKPGEAAAERKPARAAQRKSGQGRGKAVTER